MELTTAYVSTFESTIENLLNVFSNHLDPNGGGIIGAVFSLLFVKLFSVKGTYIVAGFIMLCGFIIMFNVSLVNLIKSLFTKLKNFTFKREFKKKGITVNAPEDNEDEVEDLTGKKIISSIDELTNVNVGNNEMEEEIEI